MKPMIKKFAWLTVAVAIVLAAVLTMTVGAEQPLPELSIDKFNLSLKDSIYLKYAVTAQNSGTVKLLIWTAPQDEYVLGTQSETLTSTGTAGGMLVFDYTRLSAKKMADVVYARAYTEVEGVVYYSDVRSYSILEYIYTKLGYIGNSPTTDVKLISLLELMLEYGAAAQEYQGYNLNRLATDKYYQVVVNGGTLADGTTSGLYKEGTQMTLSAPATNGELNFSHWADSAENKISTSATVTIEVGSKNETYTAVYGVFEDGLRVEYIYDESNTYIIRVEKYDDKDQLVYEEELDYDETYTSYDKDVLLYTYHENGKVKSITGYENDILYVYVEYDERGEYTAYKCYENGQLVEDYVYNYEYYSNGKPKKATVYLNGVLYAYAEFNEYGDCTLEYEYDENGQIYRTWLYQMEYHSNGEIKSEKTFVDGVLRYHQEFNEYGDRTVYRYYLAGVLAREEISEYEYYEDGAVKKRTAYENGTLSRIEEFDQSEKMMCLSLYDFDGELYQKEVYSYDGDTRIECVLYLYEDGELTRVDTYNSDDRIIKEVLYEDGEMVMYYVYEYHDNGIQKSEIAYDADDNIMSILRWNEQGCTTYEYNAWYDSEGNMGYYESYFYPDTATLKSYAEYYNDKLVEIQEFDENGNCTRKEYDENGNCTKSEVYDEDGNLTEKNEYFYQDGILWGQDVYYYKDGEFVRVECYYYDGDVLTGVEVFDSNWKRIRHEQYEAGELVEYRMFRYHDNGQLASENTYNSDDELTHKNCYDEQGNRTYEYGTIWGSDGELTGWSEFYYYSNEQLKSHTQYYADGTVKSVGEWAEDGRCTKNERYDENGNLIS